MKKILLLLCSLPSIAFAQSPVNDVPCGAIAIPVISGSACTNPPIYQWKNATFGTGQTSNPVCGNFSNSTKDVWFKFVPTSNNCTILFSQAYDISHDLAAAVYDAEACDFFYSFTECSDDDGPDNYPQFSFYDFIPGATYYLRVWQFNNTIDSGSAKICIISENSSQSTGKMGINTLYPSASLDVNGAVKIRGGTPGVNKVLTSDAVGNATWKAIPSQLPAPVAFGIYMPPGVPQSVGSTPATYTKIIFTEPEELGITNTSNSTFTAPEAGTYHFDASITFPLTSASSVALRIAVYNSSGTLIRAYYTRENSAAASTEKTMNLSTTTKLALGDKVEVQFNQSSGGAIQLTSSGQVGVDRKTRFQGYKLW